MRSGNIKMADKIKFDQRNYRIHNDKNKDLIRKSLYDYGAGRSILIDNEDEIIAGNGVYEQAKELGIPVKVIETDGKELIAVKRTDLQTNDEIRKKLAVIDNATSDTSEFDIELLKTDFQVPELQELGVPAFEASDIDIDSFFKDDDSEHEKKKKTITCPHCGEEIEI